MINVKLCENTQAVPFQKSQITPTSTVPIMDTVMSMSPVFVHMIYVC